MNRLPQEPGLTISRRSARQVKVGKVLLGGSAPISIQSMAKVRTEDVDAVVRQVEGLLEEGCEIVRLAVPTREAAKALRQIRKRTNAPLVADVHFNYRLALESIDSGVDKVRINPGYLREEEQVKAVIRKAKAAGIPIRVGANSGSILRHGEDSDVRTLGIAKAMVEKVSDYLKLFEEEDFHDVVISLKASDVVETVRAYELMARRCDYPFHIGITACGPPSTGIVASAMGLGHLLIEGIGDTLRVSLTGNPREEVRVAKRILQGLGLRRFGPMIISCPTCGRCNGDLISLVEEIEEKLSTMTLPIKVAVMGCEVNGPGEAADADIGVALGKRCGYLFKAGDIIKKVRLKNIAAELAAEVESLRDM
jgi:(E)-4-hydroxy-3-methylbut-2-enyl-diphosphate synthase